MLTSLFSSKGTILLRFCLPLNHKHNIVPPKLPARCQTDSHNLAPPKLHPPTTVSDTRTQDSKPNPTPEPFTTSPKLTARCQTDSLNPAHSNSPLGVRQIRLILLHPNLIHRTQCLTPVPKAPLKHQDPKPPTKV